MRTYSIFGNLEECEDFIWSFLYDNGLQYETPQILADGKVKLAHE